MVKVKTKKKFKGAVGRNAAKQTRGAQFGHLNLPKGLNMFKEEPGSRVSLDIMPYVVKVNNHPDKDEEYGIAVPGELWYKRPYWLHRNIGPDNQSIVCPSSIGQKCPICEYRAQLLKDGADWNDDSVKALKPSMRNLYVVIPKGNKKYDEVPYIWDISQFLFQAKLNEEIGENEEYESFPDLEEGLTLQIRFSEESFGQNKFADTSRIDFIERKKPYKESILDTIPCLDDLIDIPSYKTVEAMFFGGMDKDEAEDEEDEKPVKKAPRKPAPVEEDDEEEEDDVPFDADDEEEEDDVPFDADDEEEEDDVPFDADDEEEEEEEEEDTPPPPKRTKASEKTTRSKKAPAKSEKEGTKKKCPHGHTFGKDNEEYDECDDCKVWEACMDASMQK